MINVCCVCLCPPLSPPSPPPKALGDTTFLGVLRQLLPLMKPRGGEDASGSRSREDGCGPDELILLLVYLYSLADEAQPPHGGGGGGGEEEQLEMLERELIGALTLVVTREAELSPLLQKLTGESQMFVSSVGPRRVFTPRPAHTHTPTHSSPPRVWERVRSRGSCSLGPAVRRRRAADVSGVQTVSGFEDCWSEDVYEPPGCLFGRRHLGFLQPVDSE